MTLVMSADPLNYEHARRMLDAVMDHLRGQLAEIQDEARSRRERLVAEEGGAGDARTDSGGERAD